MYVVRASKMSVNLPNAICSAAQIANRCCGKNKESRCLKASEWITGIKLTLNLLTTTIVAPPSNARKWQMGFNSAFKGLIGFYSQEF